MADTAPDRDQLLLEEPACPIGFTAAQVERLVAARADEFDHWMHGQTYGLCDGRLYDHEARKYFPSCPTPHGPVYYPGDVARFLSGGVVVD